MATTMWEPPATFARSDVVATSAAVLDAPDIPLKQTEDVFRRNVVGLDWDLGVMVYEPADPARAARGADGRKIGVFLLHGGSGDYKSMEPVAKLYAGKFGHKAVAMTFPGRLYLDDPSRDWPGDTIAPDGTPRTPIWKRGEHVTPDQYDIVRDETQRLRYGIRTVLHAKPGTIFYDRMAGWPMAFEDGMIDAMRRHFPADEYSIYLTGHSTGGPIVFMISQRVPNVAGMIAAENSSFGSIGELGHAWSGGLGKVAGFERVTTKENKRTDPFYELYIRTWRDRARYAGPEALGQEGPNVLMRLPWLMEEIFEYWDRTKARPNFKAEYVITHNIIASRVAAAEATAKRLGLGKDATAELIEHYKSFSYPLTGPGTKPVPPILFAISKDSRDHTPDVYAEVIVPGFAGLDRPPKVRVTQFGAGVHTYWKSEPELPLGIAPPIAKFFHDAITQGYFVA